MNVASRDRLVWVWLRLLLGLAQMALASTGLLLLITIGVHPLTLLFLAGATAATIASRLLYGGRRGSSRAEGGRNH